MKQFVIHGLIPSKKNSKQVSFRNGRAIVRCSDRYTAWHATAIQELLQQKGDYFTNMAKIILTFYYGDKRKRDADNAVSSVFDTLVDAGILEDDNRYVIYKHIVESEYDPNNPRCEIKIYEPGETTAYIL